MIDKNQVEMIKMMYPHGTNIEIIFMNNNFDRLSGTSGIVDYIDDTGTIYIKRNNGTKVGLIYGVDKFEKRSDLNEETI